MNSISCTFWNRINASAYLLWGEETIAMKLDKKAITDFVNSKDKVEEFNPILKALWYDRNGDWEKAHDQVDSLDGKPAARIHAYLHRKEGDQWNADYWYRRAGEPRPNSSLEEEWEDLLGRFIE